jgi:predicted nucleotidyltransferase
MATNSIDHASLQKAKAILLGHPAVEAAYLLGSAAENRLRDDSDVDIAILLRTATAMSGNERLLLSAALQRVFQRPVDLGILSTRNLVFARETIAKGRVLAERDHRVTASFVVRVLSMYAALQVARREVLHAYAA